MEMQHSNKMLAMGIIGFVAGILLAPDKGTVTRDKLKHKAEDVAETARSKKEQAKGKLREMRNRKSSSDIDNELEQLVP